jgi:very-short-patch-repair endonuclease
VDRPKAEPGEGVVSIAAAKRLRSNMTDSERRLWYRLCAHRLEGHKFKRQVPIGPYVVDFACLNRKIIVEVDGGQHAFSSSDAKRDDYLKATGFLVLRFWNNDVLRNTDGVLEMIFDALETPPSPGALRAPPSPQGERGRGVRGNRNGT